MKNFINPKSKVFQDDALIPGMKYVLNISITVVVSMLVLMSLNSFAHATENGGSSYPTGTFGDFAMNCASPGLYAREWVIYTNRSIKNMPVQPGVTADVESTGWSNLLTIGYMSDLKVFGGNYGAFLATPWIYNCDVRSEINIPGVGSMKTEDSTSGLMDAHFIPVAISWDAGNLHFLVAQNLVITTGRYKSGKPSPGRNYMSYDPLLGFTWLDPERGHEVSFMAGYLINTKNQATDYRSGNEFHVDYNLNQFLSKQFGIGIAGYYYEQMTDDESPLLDQIDAFNKSAGLSSLDGYKSKGAAIGPSILLSANVGGKQLNFTAKWLHEYYAKNRFEGDWVYLSTVIRF